MKRIKLKRLTTFCLVLTLVLLSVSFSYAAPNTAGTSIPTQVCDLSTYYTYETLYSTGAYCFNNNLYTGTTCIMLDLQNELSRDVNYYLFDKSTGSIVKSGTILANSREVTWASVSPTKYYYLEFVNFNSIGIRVTAHVESYPSGGSV